MILGSDLISLCDFKDVIGNYEVRQSQHDSNSVPENMV